MYCTTEMYSPNLHKILDDDGGSGSSKSSFIQQEGTDKIGNIGGMLSVIIISMNQNTEFILLV